jgi:hypothetical protein
MRLKKGHKRAALVSIPEMPTLTAPIELLPGHEQRQLLKRSMAAVSAASTFAAAIDAVEKLFGRSKLHARVHAELRVRFGLPAHLSVHEIIKVLAQLEP